MFEAFPKLKYLAKTNFMFNFLFLLILGLFVECNEYNSQSQKTVALKPKHYWINSTSDTVLYLYIDSIKVQELYFVNDKLDSFWLFDKKNIVAFARNTNEYNFDSAIASFISADLANPKQTRITVWKPIRMNYSYYGKFYKDSTLISNVDFTDNPLPSINVLAVANENHSYYFEYSIVKDNSLVFGPYKKLVLKMKNGKIVHDN